MKINGVEASFHHMGIPTMERKPDERFSERFGMYTSDSDCKALRIQWHRFEPDSCLHPLIRTVPHVAFKVADLDRVIAGRSVLLGPYEPIPDFRVAIIEDGGQPIELVETTLTDEELWRRAGTGSILGGDRLSHSERERPTE
jgi:hypothetical protein